MIRGLHAMIYSSEPEALRAWFRDVLGFSGADVGEGWLIFDMPEADLGVHPQEPEHGNPNGMPSISFYCDDIAATVSELSARGATFAGPVEDQGFGLVTRIIAPGQLRVQLFQPLYSKAR
jgi:catechol 2,3-dioxygenase-like lactoylglutathione lyase family enzyme